MKIQESAQDYLESILILSMTKEHVRAADICNYFGYARATVSISLKQLRENGYVEIDSNKHVTLTDKGAEVANQMYERHQFLTNLFIKVGVSEEVAAKDACRVEHYVSQETFEKLKDYFENEGL